jgi:hypothetical protein
LSQPPAQRHRTPIADIFDETFRVYRRNFVTMVVVFGLFQIPLVIATLPFTVLQAQLSRSQWLGSPEIGLDWLWPVIAFAIVLPIVALALWTFASAGVTYVAGQATSHGPPAVTGALAHLQRIAPSLLGYVGLVVGGWLALVAVIGIAALVVVAVANLQGGMGISLVIAVLLAIITGLATVVTVVIVVTRLALSIPALVLGGTGPIGALRRSWHLVRGSTWRTLGILVLAEAVIAVIGSVVSPALIPGVVEGLMSGAIGTYVLVAVMSGVVQTVVGPILPVVITVLYRDYSPGTGA